MIGVVIIIRASGSLLLHCLSPMALEIGMDVALGET